MKRALVIVICFYIFISLFLDLNKYDHKSYDKLNTVNMLTNNSLDYKRIDKICSEDFCDKLRGDSLKESIEIFVEKYLNRVEDEEEKNTLKVKGIKITDIIYKN